MSTEIDELYQVLLDRKENPRDGSYTNQLLADEEEIAKKIGEEAIEIILAAKGQGRVWVPTDELWPYYWEMQEKVKKAFDAEGITIPFPQRDVHLHQTG